MVGLYFVTDEYGPTAGVICGNVNAEISSLRVLSDAEEWQLFVPVLELLRWDVFATEADAMEGLRKEVERCSAHTSKRP